MEKIMITKVFDKVRETGMPISINLSIEDIFNKDLIVFIEKELQEECSCSFNYF